ncbi:TlpA family protein disulfide reductase [Rubrivirga marina]|uniref:Thioredoxin domain-containing protein n=1 Tax=Rubrivirga marina TaxID=1196024 RepID=A0A271J0U8_9BACT|nr:TlpA family protein disulfide reductase [Rubrivirga marina]PAP77083.1 hypothetical protein BSZ37_11920 [Rubrivirga marina]
MPTLLVLARLALAAVFLVAGLAKLADVAGSRRALRGFGVPALLAAPLGVALPLVEVVVAVLLLPASTAGAAATAALGLLLVFSVGIGAALLRGQAPDCHCFGQFHSRPAGPATLVRNLALAALAGGVAAAALNGSAGPGALAWVARLPIATPTGVLALAGVGVAGGLTWGLLGLLRQNGRLMLRVEALEARLGTSGGPAAVGASAPSFRLPALDGADVSLGDVLSGDRPALLVFSDPGCGPCRALLPEVGRWQREHAGRWTTVVVSRGSAEANAAEAARHGLDRVLRQRDREVAEAYDCHGTPGAVLVDAQGRVASPVLEGADAIRAWVTQAALGRALSEAAAPVPAGLPVGAPAPGVRLPMVDGPDVALADLRGAEAVLVFWNPRCGYCQRMLPDLRALEADLASDPHAPRLLVVTSGTAEDARALDLRSPVLLDSAFAAGRAFGASGTPSAVRIGADGRVASAVAVGAPAVLALAAGRTEPAL